MLEKVKKQIIKFNQERDWDQFHSPENLAKSISIEAGELLECFQWDNNFNKEMCIRDRYTCLDLMIIRGLNMSKIL